MTMDLQTIEHRASEVASVMERSRALTAEEVKQQVELIQEIMAAVMEEDVHYGVIPGTKKPTLYKPGAEKLCLTFRLAPRYHLQEEHDREAGYYRVNVRCELFTVGSGVFVGEGVGRCSSDEEKYRWQKAVCEEQWQETDAEFRRVKYISDRDTDAAVKVLQVQVNSADKENTVMKMGSKRALIHAVLGATAAGDIFDQDTEDEGVVSGAVPVKGATKKKAVRKAVAKLPNFGRHAGKALDDASVTAEDLLYYRSTLNHGLDDPKRAAYREQNIALVEAITAEIDRRAKTTPDQGSAPEPAKQPAKPAERSPADAAWIDWCQRIALTDPSALSRAFGAHGIELAPMAGGNVLAAAIDSVQDLTIRLEIRRSVEEQELKKK